MARKLHPSMRARITMLKAYMKKHNCSYKDAMIQTKGKSVKGGNEPAPPVALPVDPPTKTSDVNETTDINGFNPDTASVSDKKLDEDKPSENTGGKRGGRRSRRRRGRKSSSRRTGKSKTRKMFGLW